MSPQLGALDDFADKVASARGSRPLASPSPSVRFAHTKLNSRSSNARSRGLWPLARFARGAIMDSSSYL